MYYYDQIIEKEKYWSYLIEKGFLNIYYLKCNDGIKDFYLAKIRELKGYLNSDPNDEIKKVVNQLEKIVKKIDLMIAKHNSGEKVDVNVIINYFLINANNKIEDDDLDLNIDNIKREVSKAISGYSIPPMENISIE